MVINDQLVMQEKEQRARRIGTVKLGVRRRSALFIFVHQPTAATSASTAEIPLLHEERRRGTNNNTASSLPFLHILSIFHLYPSLFLTCPLLSAASRGAGSCRSGTCRSRGSCNRARRSRSRRPFRLCSQCSRAGAQRRTAESARIRPAAGAAG